MKQRQIWLAAAVAFVLLVGAGVTETVYTDYVGTRDASVASAETKATLLAAHGDQGLSNAVVALDRTAAILAAGGGRDDSRVKDLHVRLDDIVAGNPVIGTLWTTDAGGTTWMNNNRPVAVNTDVRQRAYFQGAIAANGGLHIGEVEIGTVVPRPRFTLARTYVDDSGKLLGLVVAGINQSYLEEVFARIPDDSLAVMAAFNPDGKILLAKPADHPALSGLVPDGDDVIAPDGSFDRLTDDLAISGRQLRSAPILMVVAVDYAAARQAWAQRSIQLGLAALGIVAAFAVLTVAGIRGTSREEAARAALQTANETLEARVSERTKTVELLFRELNHRVKNNLQIIASLLRLQIRKTADPTVKATLQDSVNRVFAIADVHTEMENARGGAIELRSYVGKIVGRICDAMQKPDQVISVNLEVDDAELPLDRAVLLAIAINEAVTNAFKHAFANRRSGQLDVTVRLSDGRLLLTVRNDDGVDNNTTFGEVSGSSGLGSSIIGMMVQQMSGSVRVDRSDGYAVTIDVPTT